MFFTVSLYVALAIFVFGLVFKASAWFRYSLSPAAADISAAKRVLAAVRGIVRTVFSAKILTLLKVLLLEVLLQTRTLRESRLRWWMHFLIYVGFMLLLLMHALEKIVSAALFSDYYSTVNPFMFLRDFFGLMVLVGVALAVYRRFFMKLPRLQTAAMDQYAIIILAVIMLSGFLLEGIKITSHTRYQEMVEAYGDAGDEEELKALESLWVKEYGVVSPELKGPFEDEVLEMGRGLNESCITCHSRPQWAFVGYGVSRAVAPAAVGLDKAGLPALLWYLHFMACFIGLAYLPFSKMFHILTTPLSLLANAVMDRETADPLNVDTRQIMELDACMHCGSCTLRCSVGISFEAIPNRNILPSEKVGALKAWVSGKTLDQRGLKLLQEGLLLCTNCLRCTGVCPAGINLQELWLDAREAVLQKGMPEFLLLSPLSLYRGLMRGSLDEDRYAAPARLATDTIGNTFKEIDAQNQTFDPAALDKDLVKHLGESPLSSTFKYCFTCQTCTTACPVVHNYERPWEALGLVPHQIIHSAALGLSDLVYNAKMLWLCVGCYQCQQQCPQGVRVADVLYELKNRAFKKVKAMKLLV